MSTEYEPQSVLGWVFGIGGTLVGVPIGAFKGGLDSLDGRSFVDSVADVIGRSFEIGARFGDKHGGRVVRGVIVGIITQGLFALPDGLTDHLDG
jgi:hypothetical protein